MHAVQLLAVVLEGLEALIGGDISPWATVGIVLVLLLNGAVADDHHPVAAKVVAEVVVVGWNVIHWD